MFNVLRVLARMKSLRNTWLDVFRFDHDRVVERRLLEDYEALLDEFSVSLTRENHAGAVALARQPEHIRGFGHVKARHIAGVDAERERLMAEYRHPAAVKLAAE
jgi:indolepyruvate ferredoxin oxidoreductase